MEKQKSSEQLYKGPIFTVTKDCVEVKGKQYQRDVVHHHGGVGVLAIEDNKLLLVKQYRYAMQTDTYEIPAGKLEKDEDPYTCGLRELEEESGYTSDHLDLLCQMYSTPGFSSEKIYIYQSNTLTKLEHPKAMDEDEEIETYWVDIKEAYQWILDNKIHDAKTIIAIQHAMLQFHGA